MCSDTCFAVSIVEAWQNVRRRNDAAGVAASLDVLRCTQEPSFELERHAELVARRMYMWTKIDFSIKMQLLVVPSARTYCELNSPDAYFNILDSQQSSSAQLRSRTNRQKADSTAVAVGRPQTSSPFARRSHLSCGQRRPYLKLRP